MIIRTCYKYSEILNDIQEIISKAADHNRLKYHIFPVVNNAVRLAQKLDADKEVVEIAAFLHDYTRCLGDRENHHNSSADYAINFLKKHNFPEEKIKLTDSCIRNHRGSLHVLRKSTEEKILATADAMAHIQQPLPMFYTWYGIHKMDILEGAVEIENKLKRSWNKIYYDFVQDELKDQYECLMRVLKTK